MRLGNREGNLFYHFVYPLYEYFFAFNVFRYITFRAVYATVTAVLICFIFGPPIIEKLKRLGIGETVREDTPERHGQKAGTPSMGGILMMMSVLSSIILWGNFSNRYTILATVATIGFGVIGFFDDYLKFVRKSSKGLHGRFKLFTQLLVSAAVVSYIYFGPEKTEITTLLYVPFITEPVVDLSYFYIPFGILLLVGTTNAVNITDGLDGLAVGLVIFVISAYAGICYLSGHVNIASYLRIPYIPGSGELTVFSMSVLGACVGFLWFNSHPAEIFMGDTGSLSLGGAIGIISLLIKKEILLIIVGGVFVAEILSVIIQVLFFKTTRKRVFLMAPLHHHFELKGWHESKIIARFWIVGAILALVALSTLKIQ
ncbi:MAG TPA: phospho-N-acetylmuramoyl-pentapeptide-transferase [Spirochaetes bacterium]|nr:phospho-N-acetylmuramoyl-pentapeptide-transferase [Spirochaetota bacterium]